MRTVTKEVAMRKFLFPAAVAAILALLWASSAFAQVEVDITKDDNFRAMKTDTNPADLATHKKQCLQTCSNIPTETPELKQKFMACRSMCTGAFNARKKQLEGPPDPCAGKKCPHGCDPKTGQCKPGDEPPPPPPPPPEPKCKGVKCPKGQKCDPSDGQCKGGEDPCKDVTCPPGQVCKGGKCVPADKHGEPEGNRCKRCKPGEVCNPETGKCVDPCKDSTTCKPGPDLVCRPELVDDKPVCSPFCRGVKMRFGEKCDQQCQPPVACDQQTCRAKFPCPEVDEATCRAKFPCPECPSFRSMLICWLWLFIAIAIVLGVLVFLWLHYRAKWKDRSEFVKVLQQRLKSGGGPIEEKPTPPTFGTLFKRWWWAILLIVIASDFLFLILMTLLFPAPK